MRRPLWIVAALALVAVLVVGLVQAGGDSGTSAPQGTFSLADAKRQLQGAPAPLAALHDRANTISAADVDKYEAQLRELRGHPVVVNAWAAWCGPCKLEYPIFQRVSTRLGKRVAFLGLDVADNRPAAERFLAKTPVPYPHLSDPDSRIVQAAGARGGLPATIYYDADGKRVFIHQGGYTNERDLTTDIERYTARGA
jgi:cytochrome c biogenesis protein CcmG, thiol:disulfide interchange protein DsbE